jgi:transcriptional regulator with XRE-family HTH domain
LGHKGRCSGVNRWTQRKTQGNQIVIIGDRLRTLHKRKKLTQSEVARKTGLLRCNVGRLENRKAAPTVATLEKMAHALEIPMFQLFYDCEPSPKPVSLPRSRSTKDKGWGSSGKDARMLAQFCHLFNRMSESDVGLILLIAKEMSQQHRLPE